jgi:hypothetical protein
MFTYAFTTSLPNIFRTGNVCSSTLRKFCYCRSADKSRPIRPAYLTFPASLFGQFNKLINRTKLLRTVDELKFSALIL